MRGPTSPTTVLEFYRLTGAKVYHHSAQGKPPEKNNQFHEHCKDIANCTAPLPGQLRHVDPWQYA